MRAAVILSGKEDNFIAGADINMFTKCKAGPATLTHAAKQSVKQRRNSSGLHALELTHLPTWNTCLPCFDLLPSQQSAQEMENLSRPSHAMFNQLAS